MNIKKQNGGPDRGALQTCFPSRNAEIGARPGLDAKPFSIRLTSEEREFLLDRAGRLPLSTYVRDLILTQSLQARRKRSHRPIKDHDAMARVLAALGQSHLANNLNQLAKAVHFGALPVTADTESEIVEACGAVAMMRSDLMYALGLMKHEGA